MRYVPGSAVGELADAAVDVGLAGADELVAAPELDADAGRGHAALGVEDVGRDGHLPEPRSLDAVLARDLLLVAR